MSMRLVVCTARGVMVGLQPNRIGTVLVLAALVFTSQPSRAQFTQQGPKLVGNGAVGAAAQGTSISLSEDGNTAIVGGGGDNNGAGAAWVFTRSGSVWTQQVKLIGSGAIGNADQGASVALSADGNTAIIGGPANNGSNGAAWVFTRSGSSWTQQTILVGTGATGPAGQGTSVALSADGNTALVGGEGDDAGIGATWVFTRSGSVWTQQAKLVGSGAIGNAEQGSAVALSADGNTAIVGGLNDNSAIGAAWIFTRSGGVWTQQASKLVGTPVVGGMAQQGVSVALSEDASTAIVGGGFDNRFTGAAWVFTQSGGVWTQQSKLVGTGAVGSPQQGTSVALSQNGNTAVVGGSGDNGFTGAAWIFTRNGSVWSQQGSKLVGSGAVGNSQQGTSVALSKNRNTAIVGGPGDNGGDGALWVFATQSLSDTHDFNGDGKSDILWRDTSGDTVVWLMNGANLLQFGSHYVPGWSIVGQRDFNGDGMTDILWRDSSGDLAMWFMNGVGVASIVSVGYVQTTWNIVSTADFNGDGMGDILWQDGSGNLVLWLMNGSTVVQAANIGYVPTSTWTIVATGDFNGDGNADILWRDNSGTYVLWLMNGTQILQAVSVGYVPISTWTIIGTGDFNGDGKTDILWRDTSGDLAIWLMNGATVTASAGVGFVPLSWSVVLTGDFNGDGMSDLLWRDTGGNTVMWFMNGTSVGSSAGVGYVSTAWTVQSLNAE